jgi:hypothetical protein
MLISEFYDKTTFYNGANKLNGFDKSIKSTHSLFIEYEGKKYRCQTSRVDK